MESERCWPPELLTKQHTTSHRLQNQGCHVSVEVIYGLSRLKTVGEDSSIELADSRGMLTHFTFQSWASMQGKRKLAAHTLEADGLVVLALLALPLRLKSKSQSSPRRSRRAGTNSGLLLRVRYILARVRAVWGIGVVWLHLEILVLVSVVVEAGDVSNVGGHC